MACSSCDSGGHAPAHFPTGKERGTQLLRAAQIPQQFERPVACWAHLVSQVTSIFADPSSCLAVTFEAEDAVLVHGVF